MNVFNVEPNYLDFMEIPLLEGRDFDHKIATDAKNSIIVNEALVREFNILNPIGKNIPGFSESPETDLGKSCPGCTFFIRVLG